jgi:UPF0716 protein FxsA
MWIALFLIFVAVPLLELALLIKLGQWIGLWPTFAVIFLTAGLGLAILQQQGFKAFRLAAETMARGEPPVAAAIDGFMLMLAAGLLIAPGLITDAAGLLLLIPPVRRSAAAWGLKRMMASGTFTTRTWRTTHRGETAEKAGRPFPDPSQSGGPGPVIEGEFERLDEKTQDPRSGAGKQPKPYRNGDARNG